MQWDAGVTILPRQPPDLGFSIPRSHDTYFSCPLLFVSTLGNEPAFESGLFALIFNLNQVGSPIYLTFHVNTSNLFSWMYYDSSSWFVVPSRKNERLAA